ncbi:uncharacterized protein LOC113502100 [Trichoplusia ni]|uniref:Uncharacterized protein LOC113502100 n=1 Tax=Trichoplusia ni TaxID=7111 RepID=A0A7E5WGL9_TRINI|nr:uncharacterized protein LOC113502100 [Trichoplusia ni]
MTMKRGSKNKTRKEKKGPKPPRPKALRKTHEELARIMFGEEPEFQGMGYYVQDNTALLDLPYVGINDINRDPRDLEVLPSTSQPPIPPIPSLFRALPIHNQSGKLVLRGYLTKMMHYFPKGGQCADIELLPPESYTLSATRTVREDGSTTAC